MKGYPSLLRPAPELDDASPATDVADDQAAAPTAAGVDDSFENKPDAADPAPDAVVAASTVEHAEASSMLKTVGWGALAVVLVPVAVVTALLVVPPSLVVLNVQSRWRASHHRSKAAAAEAAAETAESDDAVMAVSTTSSSLGLAAGGPDAVALRNEMRTFLHQLGWERYDAYIEGFVNTHGVIVYRPSGLAYRSKAPRTDVIQHVADNLCVD